MFYQQKQLGYRISSATITDGTTVASSIKINSTKVELYLNIEVLVSKLQNTCSRVNSIFLLRTVICYQYYFKFYHYLFKYIHMEHPLYSMQKYR